MTDGRRALGRCQTREVGKPSFPRGVPGPPWTSSAWDVDSAQGGQDRRPRAANEAGSQGALYPETVLSVQVPVAACGVVGGSVACRLLRPHVQSGPRFPHLAVADGPGLGSAALARPDNTLALRAHAAVVLDALAGFSSAAGLCLLAAVSAERSPGTCSPSWCRRHRPKRTAAASSSLSLAPGVLGLLSVWPLRLTRPSTSSLCTSTGDGARGP